MNPKRSLKLSVFALGTLLLFLGLWDRGEAAQVLGEKATPQALRHDSVTGPRPAAELVYYERSPRSHPSYRHRGERHRWYPRERHWHHHHRWHYWGWYWYPGWWYFWGGYYYPWGYWYPWWWYWDP